MPALSAGGTPLPVARIGCMAHGGSSSGVFWAIWLKRWRTRNGGMPMPVAWNVWVLIERAISVIRCLCAVA